MLIRMFECFAKCHKPNFVIPVGVTFPIRLGSNNSMSTALHASSVLQ